MVDYKKNISPAIVRLTPQDCRFPSELLPFMPAPFELYLVGEIPPGPRVAVVGSRKADEYGLRLAHRLGRELAEASVSVVSGGAGGVDSAAIEGCLQGGGRPVAVLGTGVDVVYPASNRRLFEEVARRGALLSEYPPGSQGLPHQFVRRNRLVSGLAVGVVVVRAARKSGSLITAMEASRQQRKVMAVPGPAGDPLSAGVHDLLKDGAHLVESASDVLALLSIQKGEQKAPVMESQLPQLQGDERQVLEAMGATDCSVDDLVVSTGVECGQVVACLLQLELKGWVVLKPGMRYCRSKTWGQGAQTASRE